MQFNYNRRFSSKPSIKKKLINFFLYAAALFLVLFLLNKINFPTPMKEIKKNINNEIIKLK
jgi:hypothetical protein